MTLTADDLPVLLPRWEIFPLVPTGWRICDGACDVDDAASVVAYVEKNQSGMLDVLWLRRPCPTRLNYRNFDELVEDLNASAFQPILSR